MTFIHSAQAAATCRVSSTPRPGSPADRADMPGITGVRNGAKPKVIAAARGSVQDIVQKLEDSRLCLTGGLRRATSASQSTASLDRPAEATIAVSTPPVGTHLTTMQAFTGRVAVASAPIHAPGNSETKEIEVWTTHIRYVLNLGTSWQRQEVSVSNQKLAEVVSVAGARVDELVQQRLLGGAIALQWKQSIRNLAAMARASRSDVILRGMCAVAPCIGLRASVDSSSIRGRFLARVELRHLLYCLARSIATTSNAPSLAQALSRRPTALGV